MKKFTFKKPGTPKIKMPHPASKMPRVGAKLPKLKIM